MNDSDPRTMPPVVARAYQDPIDYVKILHTPTLLARREEVLVATMRRLVDRYGDVWISRRGIEAPVSVFVLDGFDMGTVLSVLFKVQEYGRDNVSSALAESMQPIWADRWESMDGGSMSRNLSDASYFVSDRQIVWIGAQCARSVLDSVSPGIRTRCLDAIEAAERWCIDPTPRNAVNAGRANLPGFVKDDTPYSYMSLAAFSAFMAASAAWSPYSKLQETWRCIRLAAESEAGRSDIDLETDAMDRMADIAKDIFTPTLIVRPSGSYSSSSGSARGRIVATAAGSLVGAAASFAIGRRGLR